MAKTGTAKAGVVKTGTVKTGTAKTVTVNLRVIRQEIANQIATVQTAIDTGTEVVSKGKADRDAFVGAKSGKKTLLRNLKKNRATLSKAEKMLKRLQRHERRLADDCCDKQIQNCNLHYL